MKMQQKFHRDFYGLNFVIHTQKNFLLVFFVFIHYSCFLINENESLL